MRCIARTLLTAAWLVPALAFAQVHKCKGADGSLRYSDQPCPGKGMTVGEARAALDAERPAPVVPVSPAPSEPRRSAPRLPASFFDRGPPPSQKDIEMLKDVKRQYDRYRAERSDRCRAGDNEACISQACQTVLQNRGPAEDFKACARAYKRPVGDNWIAHGGEPERYDSPARAEEGRKLSRIYPALTDLVCLPRSGPGVEIKGDLYYISEHLNRDNQQVFQLRMGSGQPPGIEYPSIEALAANVCGSR